jgi:hypothetical protein
VELEDDEKLILYYRLMKTNGIWLLKIKSELSGKKMGQSHENLSSRNDWSSCWWRDKFCRLKE